MNLEQLLAQARAALAARLTERQNAQDALMAMRGRAEQSGDVTADETTAAIAARDAADEALRAAQQKVTDLEAEIAREAEIAELQTRTTPTGVRPNYDNVARVGSEARTYRADLEPGFDRTREVFRRAANPGRGFLGDVVQSFRGDQAATERLGRHMAEERAERGERFLQERAVGTGAFGGLVIPQYLTDFYAEQPTTARPFADAIGSHDLPETGMTAYIGRVTTGTSVADQASEGTAVSEQDIDDTLMSINVRTAAGSQTMSRQSIERGVGTEDVVMRDLFKKHAAHIDRALIQAGTTGLSAVATPITFTNASPTAALLHPKLMQAQSEVVEAMLDQASGTILTVMHSRRWFWLQAQVGSAWPMMGQPNVSPQQIGTNYAAKYGNGYAGVLPNGSPVVLDNNVPTNVSTNQDEIYDVDPDECHLWEDAGQPRFIRAEQTRAKNLQVDLVIYSYYAFTFERVPHARKITGTGLAAPTWA